MSPEVFSPTNRNLNFQLLLFGSEVSLASQVLFRLKIFFTSQKNPASEEASYSRRLQQMVELHFVPETLA